MQELKRTQESMFNDLKGKHDQVLETQKQTSQELHNILATLRTAVHLKDPGGAARPAMERTPSGSETGPAGIQCPTQ